MIRLCLIGLLLLLSRSVVAWIGPNCERYTDDDHIALACNIYFEARNESIEGMMAIVAVTMNRVASPNYPNTVHEVVWARKQFSWTHDGKIDRPKNRPSWKQVLQMSSRFTMTKYQKSILCPTATQINARSLNWPDPGCEPYRNIVNIHIILAQMADPTGGALFYHTRDVNPYWALPRHQAVRIDRHFFYTSARIK